jgi:hypothetical protein
VSKAVYAFRQTVDFSRIITKYDYRDNTTSLYSSLEDELSVFRQNELLIQDGQVGSLPLNEENKNQLIVWVQQENHNPETLQTRYTLFNIFNFYYKVASPFNTFHKKAMEIMIFQMSNPAKLSDAVIIDQTELSDAVIIDQTLDPEKKIQESIDWITLYFTKLACNNMESLPLLLTLYSNKQMEKEIIDYESGYLQAFDSLTKLFYLDDDGGIPGLVIYGEKSFLKKKELNKFINNLFKSVKAIDNIQKYIDENSSLTFDSTDVLKFAHIKETLELIYYNFILQSSMKLDNESFLSFLEIIIPKLKNIPNFYTETVVILKKFSLNEIQLRAKFFDRLSKVKLQTQTTTHNTSGLSSANILPSINRLDENQSERLKEDLQQIITLFLQYLNLEFNNSFNDELIKTVKEFFIKTSEVTDKNLKISIYIKLINEIQNQIQYIIDDYNLLIKYKSVYKIYKNSLKLANSYKKLLDFYLEFTNNIILDLEKFFGNTFYLIQDYRNILDNINSLIKHTDNLNNINNDFKNVLINVSNNLT